MANEEHITILKQGITTWNEWRQQNLDLQPDLSNADLKGADLSNANLFRTNLSSADLMTANLSGANLIWADLSRAKLIRANLNYANLSSANLTYAKPLRAEMRSVNFSFAELSGIDLQFAHLDNVHFNDVTLNEANLSNAILNDTAFSNVDLSKTKGLETCVHLGRSGIDFYTLQKSWPLPEIFLRGVGLPNSYIAYLPSLMSSMGPIQFYSCFISYSHKDEEFAQRLYADLQSNGVRCWYAPEDMKSGKKIHHQIDDAIKVHDKLLLVVSEQSMKSSWVENEIIKARKRELIEGKQVLFPLALCEFKKIREWELFSGDEGRDLAREIREYFIPDFSNWKDHDSYKKAFDRLLKDLKASAVKPGG